MTVVCSSVKDTVINNSELSPKFFTAPEQRHPDGVLSRPSCNTCSREHITAGDSNTALTTTTPSCHTTQIRILGTNNPYTGHSTSKGHQSPVRRVRDCAPFFRFPGSERSQRWLGVRVSRPPDASRGHTPHELQSGQPGVQDSAGWGDTLHELQSGHTPQKRRGLLCGWVMGLV